MVLRTNAKTIRTCLGQVVEDKSVLDMIKLTDRLEFVIPTKAGKIEIHGWLGVLDGDVIFNIDRAWIARMDLFGLVRKKAGEKIVSTLQPMIPNGRIWKNEKGNIQLSLDDLKFRRVALSNGEVLIDCYVPS